MGGRGGSFLDGSSSDFLIGRNVVRLGTDTEKPRGNVIPARFTRGDELSVATDGLDPRWDPSIERPVRPAAE
jgi:hypothetical protein